MSERLYLLPFWLRAWHWTNALMIIILTITGVSLHFAAPGRFLIEFSLAARIHNIAGIVLAVAYAFFFIMNLVTGNGTQYFPRSPVIAGCIRQARWYVWGIFRGEPHPYEPTKDVKFNPLQSLLYWIIAYMVLPVVIVTGLIFFFPTVTPDRVFGLDGLLPVAFLHYVSAAAIVMFLIAHVYLGTTGKTLTSMYRMMVTGWHEH
jgi:thiosulfate reductase cytochrome b subunit